MTEALIQIFLVDLAGPGQVVLEGLDEGGGEDGEAVFQAFAVPDDELVEAEIDVLDPEADAFHDPKTGPVEELGLELMLTGQGLDEEG